MYLCYRNEGYPRVAPFTSLVYLGLNRAQREGTVTIRDKSGDIVIPSEDVFLTNDAAEATPAVLFKAGRGLQLGATAAQFIGLATAEVAARDLPGAAGAPAIPEAALLRTVRGEFVFVANGGWYLRTPVQSGATAGGWVEIRDGLYEGDTVVAQGARALWLAEIQAVNGGVSCTHGH